MENPALSLELMAWTARQKSPLRPVWMKPGAIAQEARYAGELGREVCHIAVKSVAIKIGIE